MYLHKISNVVKFLTLDTTYISNIQLLYYVPVFNFHWISGKIYSTKKHTIKYKQLPTAVVVYEAMFIFITIHLLI